VPLYLSATHSGEITETKPTSQGTVIRQVGASLDNKMVVNIVDVDVVTNASINTGSNIALLRDPSSASTVATNAYYTEFLSSEVIVSTQDIDLKNTGSHQIEFDSDKRFFVDEIGLFITNATSVSTTPKFKVGMSGDLDGLLNEHSITPVTDIQQFSRERILIPESTTGVPHVIATVTEAANAGILNGRFYLKGIILQGE